MRDATLATLASPVEPLDIVTAEGLSTPRVRLIDQGVFDEDNNEGASLPRVVRVEWDPVVNADRYQVSVEDESGNICTAASECGW